MLINKCNIPRFLADIVFKPTNCKAPAPKTSWAERELNNWKSSSMNAQDITNICNDWQFNSGNYYQQFETEENLTNQWLLK